MKRIGILAALALRPYPRRLQRNSANRKQIPLHEVNGLACHLQTGLCQQSIIPSKSDAIQTGPRSADYRTGIITCS